MSSNVSPSPALPIYRRLLSYNTAYWRIACLAVIGTIVNALCTTLFAKLIKPMLDRLFIDKDARIIFWMPFWILGIFALRSIASYFSDYGMAYVGRGVVQAIREDVFDAYLRLSDGFFSGESSGTRSPVSPTPANRWRMRRPTRSRPASSRVSPSSGWSA